MTTGEVAWSLGRAAKVWDTSPGGIEGGCSTSCGYLEQDAKVDVLFIYVDETLASLPDSPILVIRSTIPAQRTDGLSKELRGRLASLGIARLTVVQESSIGTTDSVGGT